MTRPSLLNVGIPHLLTLLCFLLGSLSLRGELPVEQVKESLQLPFEISSAPGMIAVVVKNGQGTIFSFGETARVEGEPVDEETLWAIGSISKVVTAQMLASAVASGKLGLTDPVNLYLPEGLELPSYSGRQITLLDLATHTSGYPRGPLSPEEEMEYLPRENKDFGWEETMEWATQFELQVVPGSKFDYSNFAFGLIGAVLARLEEKPFEEVVRNFYQPHGLETITSLPSPELLERKATSYWMDGMEIRPDWQYDFEKPSAAIYMTARDMEAFLLLLLDRSEEEVRAMNDLAQAMYRSADSLENGRYLGFLGMGLGWHIDAPQQGLPLVVWKDGWVSGFTSYLLLVPSRNLGIMVVTNRPFLHGLGEVTRGLARALSD